MAAGTRVEGSSLSGSPVPHGKCDILIVDPSTPAVRKPHRSGEAASRTSPSELNPRYGLMWWLYTWNGHEIYAGRGSEGHLIVVVLDQKSVTAISSGNRQEYPMNEEALFPLMNEVIVSGPRGRHSQCPCNESGMTSASAPQFWCRVAGPVRPVGLR